MQFGALKRRDFITLLGGTMAMRSLTARAQQSSGMRRIGVLMSYPETDPDAQTFLAAFREGLQERGFGRGLVARCFVQRFRKLGLICSQGTP